METEWMNETPAETPSAPETEKSKKKRFSLKGLGGRVPFFRLFSLSYGMPLEKSGQNGYKKGQKE